MSAPDPGHGEDLAAEADAFEEAQHEQPEYAEEELAGLARRQEELQVHNERRLEAMQKIRASMSEETRNALDQRAAFADRRYSLMASEAAASDGSATGKQLFPTEQEMAGITDEDRSFWYQNLFDVSVKVSGAGGGGGSDLTGFGTGHQLIALSEVPRHLHFDKEFILACVKQQPLVLMETTMQKPDDLPDHLLRFSPRYDRDVVLAAVEGNGLMLRECMETSFRADKDIVRAAVINNGLSLAYATDTSGLKKDRDIVRMAARKDPFALHEAHPSLRVDRGFLLGVCIGTGKELAATQERSQKELDAGASVPYFPELDLDLDEAFRPNPHCLRYATVELKNDANFVLEVCRHAVAVWKAACANVQKYRWRPSVQVNEEIVDEAQEAGVEIDNEVAAAKILHAEDAQYEYVMDMYRQADAQRDLQAGRRLEPVEDRERKYRASGLPASGALVFGAVAGPSCALGGDRDFIEKLVAEGDGSALYYCDPAVRNDALFITKLMAKYEFDGCIGLGIVPKARLRTAEQKRRRELPPLPPIPTPNLILEFAGEELVDNPEMLGLSAEKAMRVKTVVEQEIEHHVATLRESGEDPIDYGLFTIGQVAGTEGNPLNPAQDPNELRSMAAYYRAHQFCMKPEEMQILEVKAERAAIAEQLEDLGYGGPRVAAKFYKVLGPDHVYGVRPTKFGLEHPDQAQGLAEEMDEHDQEYAKEDYEKAVARENRWFPVSSSDGEMGVDLHAWNTHLVEHAEKLGLHNLTRKVLVPYLAAIEQRVHESGATAASTEHSVPLGGSGGAADADDPDDAEEIARMRRELREERRQGVLALAGGGGGADEGATSEQAAGPDHGPEAAASSTGNTGMNGAAEMASDLGPPPAPEDADAEPEPARPRRRSSWADAVAAPQTLPSPTEPGGGDG